MKKPALLSGVYALIFFFVASSVFSQATLNLDFEKDANFGKPLVLWLKHRYADTSLDSLVYTSGRYSLKFEVTKTEESERRKYYWVIAYNSSLPIELVRGKVVTFSAYVKAKNIHDHVSIEIDVNGKMLGEKLAREKVEDSLFNENSWKKISVKVPVDSAAAHIGIRLVLIGEENRKYTVWVDEASVLIDDIPYKDVPMGGTEMLASPYPLTTFPDLAFENKPEKWYSDVNHIIKPYKVTQDSLQKYKGKHSLFIEGRPKAENAPVSLLLNQINIDTLHNQKLIFKGKIKFLSGNPVSKKFYITYFLKYKEDGYDEIYDYKEYLVSFPEELKVLPGGWLPFSFTHITPAAQYIRNACLGMFLENEADFLLDDIEIFADGKAVGVANEKPPQPVTLAEINWLKSKVMPILKNPKSPAQYDFMSLKKSFETIRIFGLGEGSHGSHEIFEMKAELFKFLVEQQGVRVLAFEAEKAASQLVNQYIVNGKGTARQALKALGFWIWNVEEILALIEWMRNYNLTHPKDKVYFTGIDLQSPIGAIDNLKNMASVMHDSLGFKNNLEELRKQISLFAKDKTRNLFIDKRDSVLAKNELLLTLLEEQIELSKFENLTKYNQIFDAEENIRIIKKFIMFYSVPLMRRSEYRDMIMAENIYRISREYEGMKIAVWAHNFHIGNQSPPSPTMGYFLQEQFGKSYLKIGFTFGRGSYRAMKDFTIQSVESKTAYASSYEYYLDALKMPVLALDLRNIVLTKGNEWLFQAKLMRHAGAGASDDDFSLNYWRKEFDMIIYLEKSTPAKALTDKK